MTAGTRAGDTVRSMSQEIEAEITRLISYVNDKVVPEVRHSSSVALRTAAEQLGRMAENLERRGGGAGTAEGTNR